MVRCHRNILEVKDSKPAFSLLQFKESVESYSGIEKRGRGRMLWKRQYTDWAQTTDGGRKTLEQAESTWAQFCVGLSPTKRVGSNSQRQDRVTETERERERHTHTQRDSQAFRQDRRTDRRTDGQTDRLEVTMAGGDQPKWVRRRPCKKKFLPKN